MSAPELRAEWAEVTFAAGFGGRLRTRALRRLTLAVGGDRPGILAVVGESGSGKTTLLRLLLGFQPPTGGRVTFAGRDLARLGAAGRRDFRRRVQAVFQDPFEAFNPFWRVEHPLVAGLRAFGLAPSRAAALERAAEALAAVGLNPGETIGKYPHQLSGGQRQRVMIARALALEPDILLADEPVSMVDASLRATILEALWRMNRERGIALVYVTHDLATAFQVADTILVLYGGQVMEAGAAEAVIRRPRHPYTRALLDAVPSPDPARGWGLDRLAEAGEPPGLPAEGCPFAPRCPAVIPRCRAVAPPLHATEPGRASACLHDADGPAVEVADVQTAAVPT